MAPVNPPVSIRIRRKIFPAVAGRDELLVLKDIAIDLTPGSFAVLTGPSGGGKSTLLNIVAGLDKDFEGAVDLGGSDRLIAFIFQTPRLLPWRTVEENIVLPLPDGDPRRGQIAEMLESVGLLEARNAYPERISLGMQRRAALARGFIMEPDILLMDEPFVSLDDPTAQDLRRLLLDLWNRRPTTVLFVTHDRDEAVQLGTRILRLSASPATVEADVAVRLSVAERADPDKVLAEQRRIFKS